MDTNLTVSAKRGRVSREHGRMSSMGRDKRHMDTGSGTMCGDS